MTRREAAIVAAYTGVFIGKVDEFQRYIEEILKRQIMMHELAEPAIQERIVRLSKKDFVNLVVD